MTGCFNQIIFIFNYVLSRPILLKYAAISKTKGQLTHPGMLLVREKALCDIRLKMMIVNYKKKTENVKFIRFAGAMPQTSPSLLF